MIGSTMIITTILTMQPVYSVYFYVLAFGIFNANIIIFTQKYSLKIIADLHLIHSSIIFFQAYNNSPSL